MDWLEKAKAEALKLGDELGKGVDAVSKKIDAEVAKASESPAPQKPDGEGGGAPAAWLADPTGRHQFRYWDGKSWTEHVSDEGKSSTDPV